LTLKYFPETQLTIDFAFLCKPILGGKLLYHRSPCPDTIWGTALLQKYLGYGVPPRLQYIVLTLQIFDSTVKQRHLRSVIGWRFRSYHSLKIAHSANDTLTCLRDYNPSPTVKVSPFPLTPAYEI